MAVDRYKDVIVGGTKFRVGLVTALIGDWIVNQMLAHKHSDMDIYRKIQDYLFQECSVYQDVNGVPIPKLIYQGGRWLVPELDLEYDLLKMRDLMSEALDFNVGPFFERLKAAAVEARRAAELAAASVQPSA
jgi:hypothetical protein